MKTEIVNMTPQLASELLKKNTKNRKLDEKLVKEIQHYITNGQWRLTHQGIAISQTDKILDGQHRLTAIVKAGKAVKILVTSGVPDETMMVIDTGKKRTTGDAFTLLEVSDANTIAAMIAKYHRLRNAVYTDSGGSREENILANKEKYEIYLEHENLMNKSLTKSRLYYKKFKFFTISDIGAIFMYLIINKRHSFIKVSDFFDQIYMMDDVQQSPATRALSNTLIRSLGSSREKLRLKYKMAMLIKSWNAYLTGADIKRLSFEDGKEEFPSFK